MWKLYGNKGPLRIRLPHRRIVYTPLFLVGLLLIVTAAQQLFAEEREYIDARTEYDEIRERYPVMSMYQPPGSSQSVPYDSTEYIQRPVIPNRADPEYASSNSPDAGQLALLAGLTEINRDFIGWISIEGIIDYPVVQGYDNSIYLDMTFTGNWNGAGAIFMDNRHTRGFDSTVCILYGHNMKDGSMFAPLHQYYDRDFMTKHPNIAVVTKDGELLIYKVFAARYTTIEDKAYLLGYPDGKAAAEAFRAPGDTSRFLLLSTCTNTYDHDLRLLVFASLVN